MNNTQIPVVSIIMPVYNVEKYVTEAIESILSQTYTDFELIILDDSSTDNSVEKIIKFKDPRIVVHRNIENIGLAENLNIGLRLAKGKYIARMDGDDISLPERLRIQIEYLDTHSDIDLCSCAMEMFGTEHQVWIRDIDPEQVKITMLFFSPVLHASSIWRRESFSKSNLYYNQDAFPAEDYDLWSRAAFTCQLTNIPNMLYRYRIHGIQVTKTDKRAGEKVSQIQMNYLRKALPSLTEENIRLFVNKNLQGLYETKEQVQELKTVYKTLLKANKTDVFFNAKLLKNSLYKYYRNTVFDFLLNAPFNLKDWNLYFELRSRQWIKLFI